MTIRRLLPALLLLALPLQACPSDTVTDDDDAVDDDDSAADDDDSAADDDDAVDDDDVAGCDASFPFTLEITGDQSLSLPMTQVQCEDQNGDVFQWRYETDDDWVFIVRAGPLGDEPGTYDVRAGSPGSMVVTLAKEGGGEDGVTYNWLSSNPQHNDRNATIDLQVWEGSGGPDGCGLLTSDALGTFDGRMVTLGPQPIPLACD